MILRNLLILIILMLSMNVVWSCDCSNQPEVQDIVNILTPKEQAVGHSWLELSGLLSRCLDKDPNVFADGLKAYGKEIIRFDTILFYTGEEYIDDYPGKAEVLQRRRNVIFDTLKDQQLKQEWIKELDERISALK